MDRSSDIFKCLEQVNWFTDMTVLNVIVLAVRFVNTMVLAVRFADMTALATRIANAIELAARLAAGLPSLRRRHHDRGENSHMASMAGILAAIPKRPMLLGQNRRKGMDYEKL